MRHRSFPIEDVSQVKCIELTSLLKNKKSIIKDKKSCYSTKSSSDGTTSVTEIPTRHAMEMVSEMQRKLKWTYMNLVGEEWDAQPACIITDYLLAFQCFAFGAFVLWQMTTYGMGWYVIYFFAVGTSAAVGGFLHHVAYNSLTTSSTPFNITTNGMKQKGIISEFENNASKSMERVVKLFGCLLNQSTADVLINHSWRVVLAVSCVSNFALVALAANTYLTDNAAYLTTTIAASFYTLFGIWSSVNMSTVLMLVGFLPALLFLGFTFIATLEESGWSGMHGVTAMILKFFSGVVQGLGISPSEKHFNHNALAHVLLSLAVLFMMLHYSVKTL